MKNIFYLLLFVPILIIFFLSGFAPAKSSETIKYTDENNDYKIEVWRENYKNETKDGVNYESPIYGIFAKFFKNNQVVVDKFQVNPEEYGFSIGLTKSASDEWGAINNNNNVFLIYKDHETPLMNIKAYGVIYNIKGGKNSS